MQGYILFIPLGPGKSQILWALQSGHFLITYSPLIFICVDTGSRPLNQRFLITYSPLIFIGMVTSDQHFLMTYSPLIFVCMGYLAQQLKMNHKYTTIKQWLRTKLSQSRNDPPQSTFFNDVNIPLVFLNAH